MSDIVERLRLQAKYGLIGVPDGHNVVSYGDAADEIERLSARLAEVERDATCREGRALLQAQDWRAKAERLAAALRRLITHTLDCEERLDELRGLGKDAGSGMSSVVCEARAALSDSPAALAKEPQG